MNRETYKFMSLTAKGRQDLHSVLLNEIEVKMNVFLSKAPIGNKDKVAAIFSTALTKCQNIGNGNLFSFLAADNVTDKDFIRAIMDIVNNKIF